MHKMKLSPYKVHVVHKLIAHDPESRVNFCEWFTAFVADRENVLAKTFFTDEASFHLSECINSPNSRIWSTEDPNMLNEKPFYDQKVGVWCAVVRSRTIGSIFYENAMMYEWYISDILEQFFALLMKERELGWFQQDGATAHTARVSMQAVQGASGDCIISRGPRAIASSLTGFLSTGKTEEFLCMAQSRNDR